MSYPKSHNLQPEKYPRVEDTAQLVEKAAFLVLL